MAATFKHKTEKWMKENSFDIFESLQMKDITEVQVKFKNKFMNEVLVYIRNSSKNNITIKTSLGFSVTARYSLIMKSRRGIKRRNWVIYEFFVDKD